MEGFDTTTKHDKEVIFDMVQKLGHKVLALKCFGYQRTRDRKLVNFHPAGGSEIWGVHNNSYCNLTRALCERVLTVDQGGRPILPPQPAVGFVKSAMKGFTKRLLHAVRRVPTMSTTEFVDTYVGRKRKLYARVVEDININPVTRKDAYIMPFIKDEKTNLTRKDDPCPRIIQPRSPRFNVAIGVHLKPMEKPIFRGIAAVFGSTTVMKGLNASERGIIIKSKWDRFTKPFAIMLDAKRFDQHVSRDVIDWEHSVEERIAIGRDDLKRLNRMRRKNVCFIRTNQGGYKYTLNGVRMSGDMDTAMGNCLTMCGMTYSFMTELGISKYEYMNDGDDGVLIVEGGDSRLVLDRFRDYFLKFGFTMKLEGTAQVLEHVEFCQSRPVFDGTSYRFVRDPRVCLDKDSLSLKTDISVVGMRHLRDSIGWCGMSLAGDMPIFGAFYSSMIMYPEREREYTTGMEFLSRGMNPKFSPPTDEARLSFYTAYGISPDEQITIERDITNFDCGILRPSVLVKQMKPQLFTLHH